MSLNIGANIKRLRTQKNITQEQLSESMNVTCAAVSKWERGETFPDITLLQPLAYFFGVSLDELMGYDKEKIEKEIDEFIKEYKKIIRTSKASEEIRKAYRKYPNDYRIMNYYIYNIVGDADCDNEKILMHKDEILSICEKIINGCTDLTINLLAWNAKAKVLYAEGKTNEALEIYNDKFSNWFLTSGQKIEQLFAKDTDEYYVQMQKNMYELVDFAADKLGRKVFFDKSLSSAKKAEIAISYGNILIDAFEKTNETFFLVTAYSFLCRVQNDLYYRGGSDDEVIAVRDKYFYATKLLSDLITKNDILNRVFLLDRERGESDLLKWTIDLYLKSKNKRSEQFMKNTNYLEMINKYR